MASRKYRLVKILILFLLILLIFSSIALTSFIYPKFINHTSIITFHSDTKESRKDQTEDNSQTYELEQSQIVCISHDGKKEFKSLRDAVDGSEEGSTIFLSAGEYLLEEPLNILKAIRLVGSGVDRTHILCSEGEYVISYSGDGLFSAENIAFHREGNNPGDVVVINGGEINLYQCSFSGGVWDEQQKIGGGGLIILDRTYGTIQECISEYNDLFGIDLFDNSYPALIENTCRYNGASGIGYSDKSFATAYQNQCIENDYHGIELQGKASPAIIKNICSKNYECGIAFFYESSGMAYQNECSENKWGIYIDISADPILIDNILNINTNDIEDKRTH